MRSVPPRGSGWIASADCQLPIVNWPLAIEAIGNRQLAIGNVETHPLPRGGTDVIASRSLSPFLISTVALVN
jgi:hypothetical protein